MGLIQIVKDMVRKPDAILVGECHNDFEADKKQIDLIDRCNPEYVLFEGLNDFKPEDLKDIASLLKRATIKDQGVNLDNLGIDDDFVSGFNRDYSPCEEPLFYEGVFPRTREQWANTPFFDYSADALGELVSAVSNSVGKKKLGFDELAKISSLLRDINEAGDFAGIFKNNAATLRVLRHIYLKGSLAAGCDIGDKDVRNKDLYKWMEETDARRERVMGESVVKYAAMRKTDNPIIAIVGSDHLARKSGIYVPLKEGRIKYKVKNFSTFDNNDVESKIRDIIYGLSLKQN